MQVESACWERLSWRSRLDRRAYQPAPPRTTAANWPPGRRSWQLRQSSGRWCRLRSRPRYGDCILENVSEITRQCLSRLTAIHVNFVLPVSERSISSAVSPCIRIALCTTLNDETPVLEYLRRFQWLLLAGSRPSTWLNPNSITRDLCPQRTPAKVSVDIK